MIKIVTDSSSLFTLEEAHTRGIESIPLCISIGDCHYRDLQVDMNTFYRQIKEGGIPVSSQPPIGEVLEVYKKFKGQQIINISMADGLSGTYQTACSAKYMADNQEDITVVNSETLCGPHQYMVQKAQQMVKEGSTYQEIISCLEAMKKQTESFLIPQDFGFLKRGGRLTPLAATFGSVLKLKPVMTLTSDSKRLDKFAMGRTLSSAINGIIKHMKAKEIGAKYILYISHANAIEDAKKVKEMFEMAFEQLEIRMLELSPAFVTQGGPQCIAVQYIKR